MAIKFNKVILITIVSIFIFFVILGALCSLILFTNKDKIITRLNSPTSQDITLSEFLNRYNHKEVSNKSFKAMYYT